MNVDHLIQVVCVVKEEYVNMRAEAQDTAQFGNGEVKAVVVLQEFAINAFRDVPHG